MSTGVIRIFTGHGFIIAADGLVANVAKNNRRTHVVTDAMQKLYPIQESDHNLCYAITGSAVITDDTDRVVFSFLSEAAQAIQILKRFRLSSLYEYVSRLSRSVNTNLRAAKAAERIERYPTTEHKLADETGETIAEIFFDGYFNGKPASVRARFYHEGQRYLIPKS